MFVVLLGFENQVNYTYTIYPRKTTNNAG